MEPRGALASFLGRLRRRAVLRRLLEAFGALVAVLATAALVATLLEAWPAVEDVHRRLLTVAALVGALAPALVALGRLRREVRTSWLARAAELRGGVSFSNVLVTAVEFASPEAADRYGFAPELVDACRSVAAERLPSVDTRRVVPLGQAALVVLVAVAALAPVAALTLRYPSDARATARRYLVAFGVLPGADETVLVARADADCVLAGRPVEFTVRFQGGVSHRVPAVRVSEEGRDEKVVPLRPTASGFRGSLDRTVASFRFRAEAGSLRSAWGRVEVVTPPRLVAPRLRYEYPAYMGLPPEEQTDGRLDVRSPAGTVVTLSAGLTSAATSAALVCSWGATEPATVAGLRMEARMVVERSGDYTVAVVDAHGFTDPDAPSWRVDPVPDRVPRVYLLEPGRDQSMDAAEAATAVLRIRAAVEDDVGVGGLRLVWRLHQRFEYTYADVEKARTVDLPPGAPSRLTTDLELDLADAVLAEGDSVAYRVEAWDRAPGPRAGRTGRSREYVVRIPFRSEALSEVIDAQEGATVTLEELSKRQKEVDRRMDAAMDRLRSTGDVAWRDRQELEKLAARQKQIRSSAQDLAARLQETLKSATEKNLLGEAALRKLSQVRELMAEVADERMREALARMQELMQKTSLDRAALDEMRRKFDAGKYTKELDRLLSALKKLKAEQRLERAIQTTKGLAERQDELAKRTLERADDGADGKDLAEAQRKLAQETEASARELEETAAELADESPEAADELRKQAAERRGEEGAAGDMERAARELTAGKPGQALPQQHAAKNKLQASLDQLQQTRSGMQKKQIDLSLEGVLALLYEGAELARRLDGVVPDADPLDPTQTFPATEEARREACRGGATGASAAERGVKVFERSFEKLFDDELLFKRAFLGALGELVRSLDTTRDAFEQTRWFSGQRMIRQDLGRLVTILHRLTELASQLKDQAQQQGASSFMDQLQQLVERQRRLNEQTRGAGGRPKEDPMLQQLFQQMMAEQMAIRESLERLSAREEAGERLEGQLGKLAEEMRELEKRLAAQDGGEGTQERQERVVTRMLDYSRSLKQQDFSRQRESTPGAARAGAAPPPLPEDLREAETRLFRNLGRDRFPPASRGLVERYLGSLSTAGE